MEAYSSGYLDEGFREYLEEQALVIEKLWAELAAEDFVYSKLPDILAQAKEEVLV